LNADSTKIRKHLKEGSHYLSELDYEAAVATFEAVIEIEPNNEQAYIGLADAYVGCYQEVELSWGKYEYSVYLEPDNRTTLYGSK